MKKMLVSDYDDTFKTTQFSFNANIKGVKRFRSKGYLFTIATSRDPKFMFREIEKHGIEYDYLSCLDGEIIFDKNNKIIFNKGIDKESCKEIDRLGNSLKCIEKIKSLKIEDETLYYYIKTKLFADTNKLKERLDELLSVKYLKYIHLLGLFLVQPKHIDKATSINYIKQLNNLKDENIFTIGDEFNDYNMVKDYNGFTVYFANPKLYKVSIGHYLNVNNLMKNIEDGTVKVKRK